MRPLRTDRFQQKGETRTAGHDRPAVLFRATRGRGGIWLYPDPNGGRFLWAHAQTEMLYPSGLVDANGRSLAEGFPRVYNAVATVETAEKKVVGNATVAGV
jgi:hypothetical protein